MQTDLSFFRLTLLGMGLQKPKSNKKNKIKMNTKWLSLAWLFYLLDNDATRPVLTQPLYHRIDSFT
jgi:hypothetical protein